MEDAEIEALEEELKQLEELRGCGATGGFVGSGHWIDGRRVSCGLCMNICAFEFSCLNVYMIDR